MAETPFVPWNTALNHLLFRLDNIIFSLLVHLLRYQTAPTAACDPIFMYLSLLYRELKYLTLTVTRYIFNTEHYQQGKDLICANLPGSKM